MLGIKNTREQCFLTAAAQNMKRLAKAFAFAVFALFHDMQRPCFLPGNTAFVDGLRRREISLRLGHVLIIQFVGLPSAKSRFI